MMSIVPTGTNTRSGGISAAIGKQLRLINLQPVKKLIITFDPFTKCSKHIRKFAIIINTLKPLETNPLCQIKTEVVCNRSQSTVNASLLNGESVLIKCGNLDTLDTLKIFNKYISALAPKQEPAIDLQKTTKSIKKALKKK